MQKLSIEPTRSTPEILLNPDENIFSIRGSSSPEDVRALYYPVIDWIRIFVDDVLGGEITPFSGDKPLKFKTDLDYFNSSSAKFLYDIFMELKRLSEKDISVNVEWYYDKDDGDQKEAGMDIAALVEMEFTFIEKKKQQE